MRTPQTMAEDNDAGQQEMAQSRRRRCRSVMVTTSCR